MDTDDMTAASAVEPVPLRRNRDFQLLWSGQAASALGSEMAEIAYPLLILATTGSAAQAGLVGAAVLAAHVLLLLPAGVLADRYPRKRVMVVSSLVQFVAVGTVAPAILTGHVYIAHLVAVGGIQGAAAAFYIGASRGAIRRIVPVAQLTEATSRIQARDQAAYLAGPPLGGALFGIARSLPFAVDAVSFGVIALAAAAVRGPVDPERDAVSVRPPLRRSIATGMRYVFGSQYLRTVAIWAAAVNAVAMGLVLMIVVLARHRGAGPAMIGVVAATGPVGGLLGALLSPRLIRLVAGRTLVLIASWALAVCPVGMALAPWPGLIGVTAAFAMLATTPVNVILLTRMAEIIPHDMQGQAGNAMMLVGSSLKWLAPLVFGLLADGWGPVAATLTASGLYVLLALWLHTRTALYELNQPAVPEAG